MGYMEYVLGVGLLGVLGVVLGVRVTILLLLLFVSFFVSHFTPLSFLVETDLFPALSFTVYLIHIILLQ